MGWPGAFDGGDLGPYPSTFDLAAASADAFGCLPENVLVTAGADDALLRIALGFLGPGRELVLPVPTFEMIARYARLAGGEVREVQWNADSPFPVEAVCEAASARTSVIACVTPNNPTGAVGYALAIRRTSLRVPTALIVVDAAYGEFADEDVGKDVLQDLTSIPNIVVLRTMSKAYGCAGLRVGFALGAPEVLAALSAAGNPYPCATPSLRLAAQRLSGEGLRLDRSPFVERVRTERDLLAQQCASLGLSASSSQGNFVYIETERAGAVVALLASMGIAVRAFEASAQSPAALRITCPGCKVDFERLTAALQSALAPEALLFDMDGVLADVSGSYREAILQTAKAFGADIAPEDVARAKASGNANDDWALTWHLVKGAGVDATLEEVTERFEELYQGQGKPGLYAKETLTLARGALVALGRRFALGIVTGRPRKDATRFLRDHDIADLFGVVVAREDAGLKPSPRPTKLAMERLTVRTAWLIGDTPDDVRSARAAGALPIAVIAPGTEAASSALVRDSLLANGAGVCLDNIESLGELLP